MDKNKRIIWFTLLVISLIITYFFKVFPWIFIINSIPFLFGIYLLLSFKSDFNFNKPWGISHLILSILSFISLSKILDKWGEILNISFTTTTISKILFILISVIIMKLYLKRKYRLESPSNNT